MTNKQIFGVLAFSLFASLTAHASGLSYDSIGCQSWDGTVLFDVNFEQLPNNKLLVTEVRINSAEGKVLQSFRNDLSKAVARRGDWNDLANGKGNTGNMNLLVHIPGELLIDVSTNPSAHLVQGGIDGVVLAGKAIFPGMDELTVSCSFDGN